MSEIWIHDDIKADVTRIHKRIDLMRECLVLINKLDMNGDTKIIHKAIRALKDKEHVKLGQYLEKGLIALI